MGYTEGIYADCTVCQCICRKGKCRGRVAVCIIDRVKVTKYQAPTADTAKFYISGSVDVNLLSSSRYHVHMFLDVF